MSVAPDYEKEIYQSMVSKRVSMHQASPKNNRLSMMNMVNSKSVSQDTAQQSALYSKSRAQVLADHYAVEEALRKAKIM